MQKKAKWESEKKSVAEIRDQQVQPQGTMTKTQSVVRLTYTVIITCALNVAYC